MDCIRSLEKQISVPDNEYAQDVQNSKSFSMVVYNYLINSKNIDVALSEINYHTLISKKLNILGSNEYVFIAELFPSKEDISDPTRKSPIIGYYRVNVNSSIVDIGLVKTQKELNSIFSKIDINVDIHNLVSLAWRTSYFGRDDKITKCLGVPNFVEYEYEWYSPDNYDIVKKKAYILPFEKDGRYFYIGAGFTFENVKKERKYDTTYFLSLIVFTLLFVFILKGNVYPTTSTRGIISFVVIFILLMIFNVINIGTPGTYERELIEKKEQDIVVLGVAGIVIGLSVFSNLLNFKQEISKQSVIGLFNISYFILLFILIIPMLNKSGQNLQYTNRLRNFFVYSATLIITSSVIIYMFEK